MSSSETAQRSRRGVLAAALGGAAALAAQAIGRPQSASAANGDALTVGQTKVGTGPTALAVTQTAGAGIYGFGVTDKSLSAFPVSSSIAAHTKDTYQSAVFGYGQANQYGVVGWSEGTGVGVQGSSTSGIGIQGSAAAGIGVFANGPTALATNGRVYLGGVSGLATIAAGKTSVIVQVTSADLLPATFVLLTPKVNIGSRSLYFNSIDTANARFTIRISSSRSSATPVAWLALSG